MYKINFIIKLLCMICRILCKREILSKVPNILRGELRIVQYTFDLYTEYVLTLYIDRNMKSDSSTDSC